MNESNKSMRWLVALDARELSHGAAALGRWLAGRPQHTVFGIHVVEWVPQGVEETSRHGPDPLEAVAVDALRPLAEVSGVEVDRVQGCSVEEGLRQGVVSRQVSALVLGRRAPMDGGVGAIRLGRVGRRIVRDLPSPVVVVPPDFVPDQPGPVVVATDLTDTCGAAVRWAATLAQTLARSLTLTHVQPPADRRAYMPDLPEDSDGVDAFERWAERHEVGDAERLRLDGAAVPALLAAAQQRQACMLVTGSRGLDDVERLYLSSLGTELAATAPLPVALVPPT